MKTPPTLIAAVALAFLLGAWHGFYGLFGGLSQLRFVVYPLEAIFSYGYLIEPLFNLAIIGLESFAGVMRVLGAGLLCVGAVTLLRGAGRTPLVAGAVVVVLGHALHWLMSSVDTLYNYGLDDYLYYEWLEQSSLPYFVLDWFYTFAFLRTPLALLGNGLLVAVSALVVLAMLGAAFAPATTAWLAAQADAPEPVPEAEAPEAEAPEADDESTLPEGDVPHIDDPDAEATEMVSEGEVEAMLSQAAEEAAAKRNT